MKALASALCVALVALPCVAHAQEVDEESRETRTTGELAAFTFMVGSYAFRTGTMIEWALGRRADDGEPETYWIIPGALGAAGVAGALLADRRWPLRRGRALSAGTTALIGYVTALSLTMQLNGESSPSAQTLTDPATWIGSTSGLALGTVLGIVTDARPGQALYVGTGTIGGALVGTFLCGATRCGSDVGAWALTGEAIGLVATLSTVRAFNPPAREMRFVGLGGVVGLAPAMTLLGAHLLRDETITEAAWTRVSAMAFGGIVLGATAAYAYARATRPTRGAGTSASVAVLPIGPGGGVGLTAMGEM